MCLWAAGGNQVFSRVDGPALTAEKVVADALHRATGSDEYIIIDRGLVPRSASALSIIGAIISQAHANGSGMRSSVV